MNDAEKIQRVCEYINLHLDEPLNLTVLCQQVYVSKYHFHRLFAAYTGVTLMDFVQLGRMKRASYQLAFKPEMNILDIALQAGFDSHEAFGRAFKRRFQQTPSGFRKQANWPFWHEQLRATLPKQEIKMKVEIIHRNVEPIAYLRHIGSPKKVLDSAAQFIAWRKATGLSPIQSSKTYGIPYSDPDQTPEDAFQFDIAGSVTQAVPENEFGVQNAELPAGRYAVIHHEGSHDTMNDSIYQLFREWLPEQQEQAGDFPIFFQYLNFVHDVAEHELRTDILLLLKEP